MKPLTAELIFFLFSGTHRADASGERMIAIMAGGKCNLELVEKI
jgi:hypothetical protein